MRFFTLFISFTLMAGCAFLDDDVFLEDEEYDDTFDSELEFGTAIAGQRGYGTGGYGSYHFGSSYYMSRTPTAVSAAESSFDRSSGNYLHVFSKSSSTDSTQPDKESQQAPFSIRFPATDTYFDLPIDRDKPSQDPIGPSPF